MTRVRGSFLFLFFLFRVCGFRWIRSALVSVGHGSRHLSSELPLLCVCVCVCFFFFWFGLFSFMEHIMKSWRLAVFFPLDAIRNLEGSVRFS